MLMDLPSFISRPRKTMSGEKVSRGNGLPNAEIYSAWPTLPGVVGPFLEILEYKNTHDRSLQRFGREESTWRDH
jgi:hypothetical protein